MPRPFSDVFSDFPEILRSRNGDLKTTHASRALLHLFFQTNFLETALYSYHGWAASHVNCLVKHFSL